MAIPGKIVVYGPDRKFLPGSISVPDDDIKGLTGSEILEFDHRVWSNLNEKHLLNTWYDVRKHGPLRIVKPVDKLSVFLYKYCLRCEFLPQVEIRWYKHVKGVALPVEYFRHTLEHVRVRGIRSILHNVKDFSMEKLDALEEVSFAYQRITWLYHKGYLLFMDEWKSGFYEESLMDFSKDKGNENEDEIFVQSSPLPPLTITFTEGRFLKGEKGFAYGKPCKMWFKAVLSRKPDGNEFKVDIKIYGDYKGKVKQIQMLLEERISSEGIYEGTLNSFEKHPDASPDDLVEYYAVISSRYAESAFEGERLVMPYNNGIEVPWLIDCHMHINNGHAAPLPLARARIEFPFVNKNVSQEQIDTFAEMRLGKFGKLQKQSVQELGNQAITESSGVISSEKLTYMGDCAKRHRIMTVLPMDMDYAHYRGYEGMPIYEIMDNGKTAYWSEDDKKYHNVNPKDKLKWERYSSQLKMSGQSFYTGKGVLIPFYHYDPRAHLNNWRGPFRDNLIQTARISSFPDNLPAVGIKMYTALGYRPMDKNLNFPWRDYYSLITNNKIPVICHCSRGGMITHDMIHYYEHEYPENADAPEHFKMTWFLNEFVSPYAWEKVLREYPEMFLCLAHFGGEDFWYDTGKYNRASTKVFWEDLDDLDPNNWISGILYLMKTYPNFYVDLSYFIFQQSMIDYFKKALSYHPEIKKRILFGTDWWLHTLEKGFGCSNSYLKYVDDLSTTILSMNDKAFLERAEIKSPNELLAYFMVLNPMRFLQLKNVIPKLSKVIKKHPDVIDDQSIFEPDEWINSIPETIEDFYK